MTQTALSKRPRVLFMVTSANIGGTERMAASLAQQFDRKQWETRVVFPSGRNAPETVEWVKGMGVNAESNPALLDTLDTHGWNDVRNLAALIRADKPDVVNMHYAENFISLKDIIAVRLSGKRCVITVNHPTPWAEQDPPKRASTGRAGRLAHAVVAISHATKAVLVEAGIPEKKITVIPCGLPVPPRTFDKREMRQKLGLPLDAFIVGTLARLEATKRVGDLVEAAAQVPADASGKKLFLAVAGKGSLKAELEEQAHKLLGDRARFVGRVDDINEFYAACDVYCLPSQLEGFGLVYVEAAFNGVPSVATNTGGTPDTVFDGETGLLTNVGDIAALAHALTRLQNDEPLRVGMGAEARARALREFTEEVMADRYETVFRGG